MEEEEEQLVLLGIGYMISINMEIILVCSIFMLDVELQYKVFAIKIVGKSLSEIATGKKIRHFVKRIFIYHIV